jgi:hypothetical protein
MVRQFLDLYKVVVLPKPRRTSRKLEKKRWKSRHQRVDNGLKMEFEWVVELPNVVSSFWKKNCYLKRYDQIEEERQSMLWLIYRLNPTCAVCVVRKREEWPSLSHIMKGREQ